MKQKADAAIYRRPAAKGLGSGRHGRGGTCACMSGLGGGGEENSAGRVQAAGASVAPRLGLFWKHGA
jgi:hypothetical protein